MPAPLTAEQFFKLPDPEEGGKLELVDGRVRAFPPWFVGPSMVRANLAFALSDSLKAANAVHVLMSVGFVLSRDPDTVLAPDISVTPHELIRQQPRKDFFVIGAPRVAVEFVREPMHRLLDKVRRYTAAGTERVWVVWPELEAITVFRAEGGLTTHLGESILTAEDAGFGAGQFAFPVEEVFAS